MLKRTVEALLERGAIVRNLENLGERALPYKISKHKERHKRGGYVVTPFPSPLPVLLLKMHISNKPGVFLGLFWGSGGTWEGWELLRGVCVSCLECFVCFVLSCVSFALIFSRVFVALQNFPQRKQCCYFF